jgi:hypothetical protein
MKFIIVEKENLKIHVSYEAEEKQDTPFYWGYPCAEPESVHLPLPENLDPACIKAVLIDEVITLVEDPDKVAAKAQAAKDAQIAVLKASFDADVDAQMFIVYGTRDRVVANTTHTSWADMLANQSDYVPAIFPSVEVLQAYIGPKVAASRAFNIWRIGRLAQRDAAIAEILA